MQLQVMRGHDTWTDRVAADFAQLHGQVLQLRSVLVGHASQQCPDLRPQAPSLQPGLQALLISSKHSTIDTLGAGKVQELR